MNEPTTTIRDWPPANHLALEQAYEEIVSGQTEREVGVTFLTDGENQIVPVFAVTGATTSVHVPHDYHRELLKRLTENPQLDTLVFFHNHPYRIVPTFSVLDSNGNGDKAVFFNFVNFARYYASFGNLKAQIYFAVRANVSGEYAWLSAQIQGK